jgi:NitT/TauT family transport system ATP-binding protein
MPVGSEVGRVASAPAGAAGAVGQPPDRRYVVVEGLGKQFASTGRWALSEIGFAVGQGDFVSIIGPSGCGKSTLLHIMAGLSAPTGGRVLLKGDPVVGPRRDMVYVFQQYAKSIFPWKTVLDNVLLGIKYRVRAPREELLDRCREQLERVGLGPYVHYYPYQLSGGMQQRVAIARALACRPDLLLMDEPFSALDAMTRAELQDLLLRIWAEFRLTILFVTHDLDEALYLAQRVILLSAGPGRVADRLEVPLAYPRNQVETRSDPRYLDLRGRLYRFMVEQGLAGRRDEP